MIGWSVRRNPRNDAVSRSPRRCISGVRLRVVWPTRPGEKSYTPRSCLVTAGRPPRVLVDATSVPADRGGVGRYVDGLLGALGQLGTDRVDLAVVAQRSDAERYSRMLTDA